MRVSKYTKDELKKMALEVVEDANEGGLLAFQLMITISALTNMDPELVFERIKDYARA